MGFCAFSEDNRGILCIFGSFSFDFVHFWKFLVEFCAFLEVTRGIVYILEVLPGICAFSEDPRGILCII
jgi:hypothetical protein